MFAIASLEDIRIPQGYGPYGCRLIPLAFLREDTQTMEKRVYDFSPGPAVLPLPALEEAQRDLLALPGAGVSILEISHRSSTFTEIIEGAEANLRTLLAHPRRLHRPVPARRRPVAVRHGPDEPPPRDRQDGRLHRLGHVGEEGHERGEDPGQRPHGVGRQRGQVHPGARAASWT